MKVYRPDGKANFNDEEPRTKHRPEEIVAKLQDADAIVNAGKDLAAVLQALEISHTALNPWRDGHRRGAEVGGGMKCEEAKWLRPLDKESRRLKTLVADQTLDVQLLKHLWEGGW